MDNIEIVKAYFAALDSTNMDDVDQYLADASKRFDWKAWDDMQQKQFKVRVGQQKQKKAK